MRSLLFATLSLSFLLAGCDSVSERISQRYETVPPKSRHYQADQKVVFEAAQIAVRQIDFQLTRTAVAQGIVDGISRIQTGDSFSDARQHSIEIRLRTYDVGATLVEVLVKEQQESANFKGATEIVLREHGLYDSYFAALEQALKEKGVKLDAPAKWLMGN